VVAAYDDALVGEHPGEFDRAMLAADMDHTRRWFAPETNSESGGGAGRFFSPRTDTGAPREGAHLTTVELKEQEAADQSWRDLAAAQALAAQQTQVPRAVRLAASSVGPCRVRPPRAARIHP